MSPPDPDVDAERAAEPQAAEASAAGPPVAGSPALRIRPMTLDDLDVVAHHRAAMWRDMGRLTDGAGFDAMVAATREYVSRAVAAGDYHGWLAEPAEEPGHVVAGAGVLLRTAMPRPGRPDGPPITGPHALVLNVYTEPAWRRRGVAERLMRELLAWAAARGLDDVTLHASPAGRAVYERVGFQATNEMRHHPDAASASAPLTQQR